MRLCVLDDFHQAAWTNPIGPIEALQLKLAHELGTRLGCIIASVNIQYQSECGEAAGAAWVKVAVI
jgi:hypothetical protein